MLMNQMRMQEEERIALPSEAMPHLVDTVKAMRAALAVLEPWLEQQTPSRATNTLRRDLRLWRGHMLQIEQQVVRGS